MTDAALIQKGDESSSHWARRLVLVGFCLGLVGALGVVFTRVVAERAAHHALHLGVQCQADAAHGLQHARGSVLPVLQVVVKDDADREHDQRQRGPRDQQDEAH